MRHPCIGCAHYGDYECWECSHCGRRVAHAAGRPWGHLRVPERGQLFGSMQQPDHPRFRQMYKPARIAPPGTKYCTREDCPNKGVPLPATTEFFYRQSSRPDGLHPWCKECYAAVDRLKWERRKLRQEAAPERSTA